MKYLFSITLIISYFYSMASHLLGGDISYKYLDGNKYEINITLYRDCNDCKLGNDGGGSSSENCSNLKEAYVRTVSDACGNRNVGSIKLKKNGFENITQICNLSNSACSQNGTYDYGIEAHHYSGTIDFNSYRRYEKCGFQIFFSIAERSNLTTTMNTNGDNLYNFVFIDPWKENVSSPQFLTTPKIIYPVNTSVFSGDYTSHLPDDSLAFHWAEPLSGINAPLFYSDGFSVKNFLTSFCSDQNRPCTPNPDANPPTGIYLNGLTGEFIFQPIKQGEVATRVIEIEQWRTHEGKKYLASTIRRDELMIIKSANSNESPRILANEEYNVCLGQSLNEIISALDINPSNGLASTDSVQFRVEHNLAGLIASTQSIPTAPFRQINLNFTPKAGDIGEHKIYIYARDNFCPEYGQAVKEITIRVNPKPEVNYSITEEYCGNIILDINSPNQSDNVLAMKVNDVLMFEHSISAKDTLKWQQSEVLDFSIYYSDAYGCLDTFNKTLTYNGNLDVTPAVLQGDLNYCSGDSITLALSHPSDQVVQSIWTLPNGNNESSLKLKSVAEQGLIKYDYVLKRENLYCRLRDSATVVIKDGPSLEIKNITPICFADTIHLDEVQITPNSGKWYYGNQVLDESINITSILPNIDTFLSLRYIIERQGNDECGVTAHIRIPIGARPEMRLASSQICSEGGTYRLTNSVKRPFQYSIHNITWEVLDDPNFYVAEPYPSLDIDKSGDGLFTIVATNSYDNGCVTTDTAIITVDSSLVLTSNGRNTLCQGDEEIYLDEYFGINITGGHWQLSDNSEYITNSYTPKECKDFTFQYFYHLNGCHNQLDIPISTVCKPTFGIDLPSPICQDNPTVDLHNNYTWTRNDSLIDKINPRTLLIGNHTLNAVKSIKGCAFDTVLNFELVQPLSFSYGELPKSLCEGEVLPIHFISTNDETHVRFDFCSSQISTNKDISYTPNICDLENRSIEFMGTSFSNGLCPSHTLSASIDYYPLPRITRPEPISGCEPLQVNSTLTSQGENLSSVRWTLTNSAKNYSGFSDVLFTSDALTAGEYDLKLDLISDKGCRNKQQIPNIVTVHSTPEASFRMANNNRVNLSNRELSLYNYSTVPRGQLASKWYYARDGNVVLFSENSDPIYTLPADTGIFQIQLVAISDESCTDTASNQVLVVPDIIAFIPSAFTPNNKGPKSNNEFRVISDHASSFYIDIFNKWGEKVYHSTDINESWDGTANGGHCQTGVYVYAIKLINESGIEYTYEGTINLIR